MLATIIDDVVSTFRATFFNGDWVGLGIAFAAVLIAALIMRRGAQIGSMTLMALVLFAFFGYMRGVFGGNPSAQAIEGGRMVGQLEASWTQFMNMQAGTLLAYFLAFMIMIFALFGVKQVVGRG